MKKTFHALLVAGALAASLGATTISYASLAAWNAAVSGLQQNAIDFTNVSTSDQNMWGYSEDGATFKGTASNGTQYLYGRTYSGGFVYGPFGPGSTLVTLPAGAVGVAFDMGRFYGLAHPTDFIFSTGEVITMTASSGFIGFTNVDPIADVTIRVQTGAPNGTYGYTSDSPILYDAYLAVDPTKTPEPASSALAGIAAAGWLWLRRRRATSLP